jgi:hypothetical protein
VRKIRSTTALGSWFGRNRAFTLGLGVGLLAAAGLVAMAEQRAPSGVELQTRIDGAGISADSAARIVIADDHGAKWEQSCNGGCDDVVLAASSTDALFNLTVADRDGRPLVRESAYVTPGVTTGWTLKNGREVEREDAVAPY